jgi:hypothetical protein
MIGLLLLSHYEPEGISDSTGHAIGWAAIVILVVSLIVALALAAKEGTWKLWKTLQIELSDDKIIRKLEGSPTIEIPLTQIGPLYEYPGGLIIRSDEPTREIVVPREVNDFEALKSELTAYCTLSPLKVRVSPRSFLSLALLIGTYLVFFVSRARVVVTVAGVAALVLHGIGIYSLNRILRERPMPRLLTASLFLSWLVLAWVVWQRILATI